MDNKMLRYDSKYETQSQTFEMMQWKYYIVTIYNTKLAFLTSHKLVYLYSFAPVR